VKGGFLLAAAAGTVAAGFSGFFFARFRLGGWGETLAFTTGTVEVVLLTVGGAAATDTAGIITVGDPIPIDSRNLFWKSELGEFVLGGPETFYFC